MASLQLKPTARMAEAVSQVPKLMVSVAQYAIQVHIVQVWFSTGTGSISSLVQTYSGARADFCFGNCHAETVVKRSFTWRAVGMCSLTCCAVGTRLLMSLIVEMALAGQTE